MIHDKNQTTRRNVLKSGAIATVGLTGLSGIAAAKGKGKGAGGGGRGFITTRAMPLLHNPFVITEMVDNDTWNPTDIAPSCEGNSKPQSHVPYHTSLGPWIFFPANRNVNLGNEYEVVTYTESCSDVDDGSGREWIKVVTKPA